MKNKYLRRMVSVLLPIALISGCSEQHSGGRPTKSDGSGSSDFVYQYSIMDAFLAGAFDGNMTFSELKKHGNFGIGGFNGLDGELLLDEGHVYRMRSDGTIHDVADRDRTGIAFVKHFKPDMRLTIDEPGLTYERLKERLAQTLDHNSIYAIRVTGKVTAIEARAPHAMQRPYRPFAAYVTEGGQKNFHFQNVSGTFVGFYMPDYMARTNVPGFHTHFITDDKNNGGHVLDFTADGPLAVEIDKAPGVIIEENTHPDWKAINLRVDRAGELKKVE